MHVVAETLTAHGFAAHAEDRGETTAVVAEQCPFGDASSTNPVLCAVDRGMVKGLLAGLCGDGVAPGAPGDPLLAGPGRRRLHRLCLSRPWLAPTSTTPARRRRAPRRSPRWRDWAAPAAAAIPVASTRRAASSATRSRRPASRWPTCSASRPARWSSPRARPRRSTPPSGARPGPTRARRCSAPRWSTRPSATPRRAPRPPRPSRSTAPAGSTSTPLRERLRRTAPCPRPALVHCQWANHEVGTLQPVHEVVALCREAGRHGARRRRRGVRPRADGPGRARRRPGQRQRAQARGRARGRRADRAARAAGSNRSSSAASRSGAAGPGSRRSRPSSPSVPRRPRWPTTGSGRSRPRRRRPGARSTAVVERRAGGRGRRGRRARRPEERLPHLVCLGVDGVEAEPVLIGLDRAGVAVHSGSACSSESIEPSPVLEAMGVDPSHSLRVSVGWTTTDDGLRRRSPRPSPASWPTCAPYGADGSSSWSSDGARTAAGSGCPAAW